MRFEFPDRFFVTGTDTGVGKTFVCALLALGLDFHYWKPVQSGSLEGLDSEMIRKLGNVEQDRIVPEKFVFSQPLSPHLAAEIENSRIDIKDISLEGKPSRLIIEGAGGVMVPLNEKDMILDLIKKLDIPALVIAPNRLGVINHTLLTISALRGAGVNVAGVILNRGVNDHNMQAIEQFGGVSVPAQISELKHTTPTSLEEKYNELFL